MEQQTTNITAQLRTVNENIQAAVKESPWKQEVRLMAASKYNVADKVKEAYDNGLRHFGENYVDELVEKSAQVCESRGFISFSLASTRYKMAFYRPPPVQ